MLCNAKKRALRIIEGIIEKQYELVWNYFEILKGSNENSTVVMKTEFDGSISTFQHIYIYLEIFKRWFIEGCRLTTGLSDCNIKGQYQG